MDITLVAIILCIVFIATLVRSTFGFGDALMAMPLLTLFVDIKIVTPLIAVIAFTIAMSIALNNWHKIEFKSAWRLIISSLFGIPAGIWFLHDINENAIKIVLGIVVLLFALYKLRKPKTITLKNERLAWIFGFIAGMLGGAYNTNGPPVIIYSSLKRWKPQNFRATLQGYFFITGVLIIASHAIAGNFTGSVLLYYACCLPVVIVAILLGKRLNRKFAVEKFHKYIYILLTILGLLLIVNSSNGIFS